MIRDGIYLSRKNVLLQWLFWGSKHRNRRNPILLPSHTKGLPRSLRQMLLVLRAMKYTTQMTQRILNWERKRKRGGGGRREGGRKERDVWRHECVLFDKRHDEVDIVFSFSAVHNSWKFHCLFHNFVSSYTKPKGQLPDYSSPVVLKEGKSSIEDFCDKLHRNIIREFKMWVVSFLWIYEAVDFFFLN